MRDQKGFAPVVLLLIVLAFAAAAVVYYYSTSSRNQAYLPSPMSVEQTHSTVASTSPQPTVEPVSSNTQIPTVKSAQDLNTLSNDLDSTNVDDINQGLSQNDSDSSSL